MWGWVIHFPDLPAARVQRLGWRLPFWWQPHFMPPTTRQSKAPSTAPANASSGGGGSTANKGKAKVVPPSPAVSEDPATLCAICYNKPARGDKGEHRCAVCTKGAWLVCKKCDEKLAGGMCPMCRNDYARQPAAWESEPPSTTSLTIYSRLTQSELVRLTTTFPQLQRLILNFDYEFEFDADDGPELEFSGVVFPHLTHLRLEGVPLRSLTFTAANMPSLEVLALVNCVGGLCPFHLALPELKTLVVEHTHIDEREVDHGQFGLSLSRCPKLEVFDSYKFRGLGDSNFLILPSIKTMRLQRADGLRHLDIVYAPHLTNLTMRGTLEISSFRLRHVPGVAVSDVMGLLGGLRQARESARQAARAEDTRWRAQAPAERKRLTREAKLLGWIGRAEDWVVSAVNPSTRTTARATTRTTRWPTAR